MRKLILTLAALFFCTYCSAQYYGTWEKRDSTEYYVFADIAYVRADTSTFSPILDSLIVGDKVKVLYTAPASLTLKGITAPWVKLQYAKDDTQKEGYMWSPLLSFTPLRRGDTKFIYGVDRWRSKDTVTKEGKYTNDWYDVKLKVVTGVQKLAETEFRVDAGESSILVATAITDGKGLKNVQHMPSITFGGGACGVGSNTYGYTWNGKELHPLPVLYGVGDGGVYYYTEELIFPADKGGKPGIVTWSSEEGEGTERLDKNGDPIFKIARKKKVYTWDGEKLNPR